MTLRPIENGVVAAGSRRLAVGASESVVGAWKALHIDLIGVVLGGTGRVAVVVSLDCVVLALGRGDATALVSGDVVRVEAVV